jgi:hypothetical protein
MVAMIRKKQKLIDFHMRLSGWLLSPILSKPVIVTLDDLVLYTEAMPIAAKDNTRGAPLERTWMPWSYRTADADWS